METNPKQLVLALIILITASEGEKTLSDAVAFKATSHLKVPKEWVSALIGGWSDYQRRYKKPLFRELSKKGAPRFLTARMLRKIKFTSSSRSCRLCGQEVFPPKRNWHTECWGEFKPYSAQHWSDVCKQAFKNSGRKCEMCKIGLTTIKVGRKRVKTYQFDHIEPVALGGTNTLDNIQVLCTGCHREKTRHDMQAISEHKKKLLIEK
jgi:5-methylcytosine-specific restriction endonuclease McrA